MTPEKREGRIHGATFPNNNLCNQRLDSTEKNLQKQAIPRPGTALTAFLNHFKLCPASNKKEQTLTHVDALLELVV